MNATTDELVTIYVEDLAYQVKTGGNLLEASLHLWPASFVNSVSK